jgi:hypothetical protein
MFPTQGIAHIYWRIDYTPNLELAWMFPTQGIAHMYWPIDYTPNIGFD